MLVTIEGIDGAGKSTVVESLKQRFPDFVYTREPTESWLGESVDRSISDGSSNPLTDFFLFAADHADHIERVIQPKLEKDATVVCDRYIDSRYAYQSVTLEPYLDSPLNWLRQVHDEWTVYPDLTLLLEIPVEEAVKRKEGDNKIKYEKVEFLEKVASNYDRLAEEESNRYRRIDATQDPEDVADVCIKAIEDYNPDT